ncbi:MAG TPA: hypothetical protein VH439_09520 [Gemmatimonadales bacterium]
MTRSITRAGARASLTVLAVLLVSGCSLTFDATELGVPTSMAESAQTPPEGTPFRVTKHPTFLLWGLAGASRPNVEDVLAGQLGTGGRIANLRIKVRTRWSDLLVTALTLGFLSPRTVTFEGVVVPGGSAPATGP